MQAISKSKGRILCSEDNADSRELMIFVLRQEGYEVIATKNSTDALALVKLERFDLILVDDWMRGLSGPDLTRQIRLIQTLPSFFTPERRSNPTSKRPTMPAPRLSHKPLEITDLVDEVARLIAEAKIAFPVAIHLP